MNIFLKNVDMVAIFLCGSVYLPENRASLALQFAEEMLNSHWVIIFRIKVEILCAASLRDFSEVEISAVRIEHLQEIILSVTDPLFRIQFIA